MDVALLATAFVLGFAVRPFGLPPLVGYLAAGFLLHAVGFESTRAISEIADLGVILLLFGIGLKLRGDTLRRPQVWGTAALFAIVGTAAGTILLLALRALGVPVAADMDLTGAVVVGFALSFCSTVFAVKSLERTNESQSLGGRVAIGILVLQDLMAVAFLVLVAGAAPSPWALVVLPGLVLSRPLLGWLLDRAGHDEILILLGVTLALGAGAELFTQVGLKPDLGALVVGLLLSTHRRAPELAGRLLDLKDLLLVAFFLDIGLQGVPTLTATLLGAALVLALPVRSAFLVVVLTRLQLRVRTALQTSAALSSYSEFGLIVVTAALAEGMVGEEWLATIAVSVGLSFLAGSIAERRRPALYERYGSALAALEDDTRLGDDAVIDLGDARIVVFGMGRVGSGAYDELVKRRGPIVHGVDHDVEKVAAQIVEGRDVILGNALDRDFWERLRLHGDIELVVAAMGVHRANLECVRRVRRYLPDVPIAAIATYADQVEALQRAGCDVARYLYDEAGQALADDAIAVVYGDDPAPS